MRKNNLHYTIFWGFVQVNFVKACHLGFECTALQFDWCIIYKF